MKRNYRSKEEGLNTPSVIGYKHTEHQRSGSFEVLTLGLTLGNGSGTDFGASQCIPIGPWHCRCRLTLGVFAAIASGTEGRGTAPYMFLYSIYLRSRILRN